QAVAPNSTGGSTDHAVASVVPAADTTDPLHAALTDAVSQPITLSHTAASDTGGAHTLDSSASAADVAAPATADLAQSAHRATDTLANVAPGVDATQPVLSNDAPSEVSHPADSGNLSSDTLPYAAPVVD